MNASRLYVLVILLVILPCCLPGAPTPVSGEPLPTKRSVASKSAAAITGHGNARSGATTQRRARSRGSIPPTESTSEMSEHEGIRGIWITTDSPRDWDAVMTKLKRYGLNAVFVRVARGGNAIYPSRILPQDQWAKDTGEDELSKAIAAAHRHGIQFHAWKVCFHMASARRRKTGKAANDFYRRMAKEDRLVRNSRGKQSYWLNPSDPRNQQLEVRTASELVRKYAVDGYHLDYIRYPDSAPGFDYHFGTVSRREFERSTGMTVQDWPQDVISGRLKSAYEAWERDNITQLVRRIFIQVKTTRPGTLVSAAVWRNIHRQAVKQDWPHWAEERLLDFVVPMNYTKDLENFRQLISKQRSYTQGKIALVAGIGNWQLPSAEAVVAQVQAARELGANGYVLFSFNAKDLDQHLTALARLATQRTAKPGVGRSTFR